MSKRLEEVVAGAGAGCAGYDDERTKEEGRKEGRKRMREEDVLGVSGSVCCSRELGVGEWVAQHYGGLLRVFTSLSVLGRTIGKAEDTRMVGLGNAH